MAAEVSAAISVLGLCSPAARTLHCLHHHNIPLAGPPTFIKIGAKHESLVHYAKGIINRKLVPLKSIIDLHMQMKQK